MIELGDKVKDKVTGFVGTTVCKMEFLNKCVQFTVVGKVSKDNKFPDQFDIDEQSLEVVKKAKKEEEEEEEEETNGGATTRAMKWGY